MCIARSIRWTPTSISAPPPDSARFVGEAYLRARPHEGSFAKLIAHLKADLDLLAWHRQGAVASDLHERLQARAAIDYSHEECAEIEGCYLSITELRLCALGACL